LGALGVEAAGGCSAFGFAVFGAADCAMVTGEKKDTTRSKEIALLSM